MNDKDIIVFDFETGGLRADHHEAIQVAGKAYHARSLEPYPVDAGGEFCSLMKPLYFDRLEEGALKVNNITRAQLEAAPDQKLVWNQFVDWVKKFNRKGTVWGAPIPAGKNIRDFDLKFVEELNKKHCKLKEKTVLFDKRTRLDLEDFMFHWFENEAEPGDGKMDTLRDYFGMSHKDSHSALTDARQTGDLIMKFLKLHRELQRRKSANGKFIQFKGCFASS